MYQSEAAAAEAAAAREAARAAGLAEYEELKQYLLFRTWRFGLLFAGYLLLAASAQVSFPGASGGSQRQHGNLGSSQSRSLKHMHGWTCTQTLHPLPLPLPKAAVAELVGAAASYGYLRWLMRDVDSLAPGDPVALRLAEAVQPRPLRWLAKLGAAYSHALRPRLLVLVGLAAACAAVNAGGDPGDPPLGLVELGCCTAGFLSYKASRGRTALGWGGSRVSRVCCAKGGGGTAWHSAAQLQAFT